MESLPPGEGETLREELPPELFTSPTAPSISPSGADLVRPVVTLTTIPSRLGRLGATLNSLLDQEGKPDALQMERIHK